jgi:cobalt-zinc-cadmium efflux system membrane fusion protein
MKAQLSASLAFFLLLLGCETHKEDKKVNQKFCLSDSLLKIVKFDTVKVRPLFKEVRMTGKISFDDDKVVRVFPPVSGLVQDVTVSLGDYVQKGQVLAKIKSSDMASYNSQYRTAIANESIAKRNMEFTEELYKSGAAAEKDLSIARDNYKIAIAEIERIKQVLAIFGEGGNDYYLIIAPISGFIVEKKITEGTILRQDASDNGFTISDLKDVWVLGNAFERDLEGIEVGDSVSVKTLAYNKIYRGVVNRISTTIDPLTKANKVRVVVKNSDFKLHPEMFASVTIHMQTEDELSSIHSESSIFNENRYFMVAYDDRCKTRVIPITPHSMVDGIMYLKEKIPNGTQIISKYQLIVYSKLSNAN